MLNKDKIISFLTGYLSDNPSDMASFLSCFIPILVCLFYLKSTRNSFPELLYYSIAVFSFGIVNFVYAANSRNNHKIQLAFCLVESLILVIFYTRMVVNLNFKKLSYLLLIVIFTAIFYNVLNDVYVNNYSVSIQALAFIIISLFSFYYILSKPSLSNLLDSVFFWVNTGVIIYFSGAFFVFLFIRLLLIDNEKTLGDFFIIYNMLLVVFRLLISLAISKSKN
jgi:hypothetical protein